MSFRLLISSLARDQLWEISRWYAETSGSVDVGLSWYNGFHESLSELTESPLSCPFARESDQFPFELRELHYGSGRRTTHRALFRVVEDRVEVLAIRHHAQQDVTPDDLEIP